MRKHRLIIGAVALVGFTMRCNVRRQRHHTVFPDRLIKHRAMEREGERNFIMQVVCESTQHTNPRVQVPAYSCLVRIMQLYYEKMKFYMEKALFGLTVIGMRNPNLDVATQAVEFWSSVCEEELDITAEIQEALEMGEQPERENYNFAKTALMEVLPQILQLLFRQDEDDVGRLDFSGGKHGARKGAQHGGNKNGADRVRNHGESLKKNDGKPSVIRHSPDRDGFPAGFLHCDDA